MRCNEGELITDRGSLWVCTAPSSNRPGDNASAFRLIVKNGSHNDNGFTATHNRDKAMSVTCHHVSIDELVTLNDRLAFRFRSMGLKDRELDQAIVDSLQPALRSLEASRAKRKRTRSKLKVVED